MSEHDDDDDDVHHPSPRDDPQDQSDDDDDASGPLNIVHPEPLYDSSPTASDDMATPRASAYGQFAQQQQQPIVEDSGLELNVDENYFGAPPPTEESAIRPALFKSPSQLLSLSRPGTSHTMHSAGAGGPLAAKATVAVSLPEGVHATQHDGMANEGSGSITTAPSFSDSLSVRSEVPTVDTRDNDIEEMLSEILEADDERLGAMASAMNLEDMRDVEYIEEEGEGDEDNEDGYIGDKADGLDIDEPEVDQDGLTEEEQLAQWRAKRKHFFILSSAGKPVYARHGTESIISSYMGVLQAIISFFADKDDELQSFQSGQSLFVVTSVGPLYLVAITCLPETVTQIRLQLDALHTQILSTLTQPQLTRVFTKRSNFDLRRLLGGTEVFLDGLADSMAAGSAAVLLSSLECIKLRAAHRAKLNNILLTSRCPELLYGLIVAGSRLVSVVRPKRHSLHPPDLQLLFGMLFNAHTFDDVGTEHWTPLCLPKFNSRGFLHAYIHFFRSDVAIVLISAQKDAFFALRTMRETVLEKLDASGIIPQIENGVQRYTPADVVPGTPIIHFLYKSRQNVQFTMPRWPGGAGGDDEESKKQRREQRRLMNTYHRLHAMVHEKRAHLKAAYVAQRGGEEAMAWVMPAFEMYIVANRRAAAQNVKDKGKGKGRDEDDGGVAAMRKEALVRGAQKIVMWVKTEEERLFVIGGAMF